MKYRQLTREQFESLHKEFAIFLATQKIDADQWNTMRLQNPTLVEEELDLFSDMVWEDVLTRVEYLEHFSKNAINFFKCAQKKIHRIVVTVEKEIDLLTDEGFKWLMQHPKDDKVDYFRGSKQYLIERNKEVFQLIEKGSQITKGQRYEYFNQLIQG